jgi:serine phosphatase RsbU (regulator of sigma subunit)
MGRPCCAQRPFGLRPTRHLPYPLEPVARMPRLIMIEGPRSGDSFQLGVENYLGIQNGALALLPRQDRATWCYIRGAAPDRYELRNMGPPDRILVNGEGVRQALLHHGDLISIHDSLMIFDSDGSEQSETSAITNVSHAQQPQGDRFGAIQPGEASDMMLGTVSIKREELQKENINYRQKHYADHDQVLSEIKDDKRLKTLFQVISKISNILDLQKLLDDLLGIIFEVLPADRGSILLYDEATRRLRTVSSKSRRPGNAKVKISKTIVKEVLRTKDSLLTADAQKDQRLDMAMSIVDENIRSALCVPLVRGDKILGIIFLDTFEAGRAFGRDDCDMLTAISMQSAMAIENARLIQEMGDRERIRHELDLAAMIQKQLLPKKLPRSQFIEVYGKMIPAKEMSGDYFDFMDHEGNGNFHICIGDVSGKGLPAGLVMIMARSYFRPLTKAMVSPRQILAECNRMLHGDTRRDVFMSALLLYWSDETGKFVWSGAGHEHLIVYRARTRRAEAIKAGGCVLAAVRDADAIFQEHELFLEPGDSLVLYTDGVTEAKNPAGEFFAQETLDPVKRLVELYGHLSAKDLLEAILWELKQFINGAEQADDITVVTVKRPLAAPGALAGQPPAPAPEA